MSRKLRLKRERQRPGPERTSIFAVSGQGGGLAPRLAEAALLLARRLGADLLELDALHHRQRGPRRALVGIAEGAAVGLDPLGHRVEELALPRRQLDAGL